MDTSIGARSAIERQTGLGTSRTRSGTTCGLSNGQKLTQKLPKPFRNATRKKQRNAGQQCLLSGRRPIGRSATPPTQGGRLLCFAQRLHGRIRAPSQAFTPKQCASRKKLESASTLTISCRFKARSFAGCTLNRTCKSLTVPTMRVSAISDGRTCHNRIEQAYAQPRLFEDAKVSTGDTAVQGDLLTANALAQGREHSERPAGAPG